MKPRVDFYIKPYRHMDFVGNEFYGIKVGFYVVDIYNPERCQQFCHTHYIKMNQLPDLWENVISCGKYDKQIFKMLFELLVSLERWEENSDVLIDVIGTQWREYPKPLVYKIIGNLGGIEKTF